MKPYGMWQAHDFLSTPQLRPRLWQACLTEQVPLVPPCQHISTPSPRPQLALAIAFQ